MKYKKIVTGTFHSRPNRFIANVWIEDKLETVHVKNTGRCKELLLPGSKVILEVADQAKRKTKYDLICVYKENLGWVNIDSQAPNKVVKEWLMRKDYTYIKPEYTYGESRIDFYMEVELFWFFDMNSGYHLIFPCEGFTVCISNTGNTFFAKDCRFFFAHGNNEVFCMTAARFAVEFLHCGETILYGTWCTGGNVIVINISWIGFFGIDDVVGQFFYGIIVAVIVAGVRLEHACFFLAVSVRV